LSSTAVALSKSRDVGSSSASLVVGAEQAPLNKAAAQTAATNKIWWRAYH
jgi:hypothetical protein